MKVLFAGPSLYGFNFAAAPNGDAVDNRGPAAQGDITRATLLSQLKRRGVFQDDFSPEDEEASLLQEQATQSAFDAQFTAPMDGGDQLSADGGDGGDQGQMAA